MATTPIFVRLLGLDNKIIDREISIWKYMVRTADSTKIPPHLGWVAYIGSEDVLG